MRLLHRLLDWDCNHRYSRPLQRLHSRIHEREDKQQRSGRHP
jgi:hypothetical protein